MNSGDALKVERVPKFFENLKFFWDDAENGNNDAHILKKHICFLIFDAFCYFWIFKKFIKTWIKNWIATIIID